MSEDLADFWVHTVTVATLTGSGGMGDTFAAPADVACFVDDKRRLVRGPDANQLISETTVYAAVELGPAFAPGSLVDLPSGRQAKVITCAVLTSGELELPDHVQAALT